MAYSFTDIYRPLRTVLRINGAGIGCAVGGVLLLAPSTTLLRWGMLTTEPMWTTRLAGALLIVLGVYFLMAAGQAAIDRTTLVTSLLGHGLIALVLLMAYLQRDLAGLNWLGRISLVVIFILCLAGALLPLRYLRLANQTF